ncbi:plasmid partitioning protein RepB [Stagnihabitans tardus]|uniref:Plasmid partitioning protein RepB n=1 Tax=Stagnihabitans tardus TaxID=2699202 RepID=A0AAE4YB77_9RHOB|nr:plasmid partitioning protein RepB [Stagnihabitans tardus]NBZ89383.1 plasmid partitioning protein RepB [Stagnihabitans tardus]
MSRKPRLGQANPALSTLYAAPDIVEARRLRTGVVELDPDAIEIAGRIEDRLQLDIDSLTASIAENGQRVPILVRPLPGDRYQLVYGRRRLEACRRLGRQVRAIVADMDAGQSLKDQLIENLERRDLSFIERAMVAHGLLEGEALSPEERSHKSIAEIFGLTEAGISQLVSVVKTVGADLIQAIGAAEGIGRPRWEELKKAIQEGVDPSDLLSTAQQVRAAKGSEQAFKSVLTKATTKPQATPRVDDEADFGAIKITKSGRGRHLRLEITARDKEFVNWMERNATDLVTELHERWKRSEA